MFTPTEPSNLSIFVRRDSFNCKQKRKKMVDLAADVNRKRCSVGVVQGETALLMAGGAFVKLGDPMHGCLDVLLTIWRLYLGFYCFL